MSASSTATKLIIQTNKCKIATCNLNQWALDFDGNLERIIESIKIAKDLGAKYRIGPELELSGYSCEDHFLELDTMIHCDQSLAVILESDLTDNILCDIGCPILHNNVRYNCRIFCLNRKIILIRPKISLADDGNYREKRYFTSWDYKDKTLHEHLLSDILRKITKQNTVPIGLAILSTEETTIASEICEELWTADSPHINLYLSGVEIISNGSGSHHELRKLDSRLSLIKNATNKCGGVYLYSNSRGCDGNRLYFDGSSLICINGDIVAQASQFSLNDVEVITAVVDLENVRSYRGGINSLMEQSSRTIQLPVIDIRYFSLRIDSFNSAQEIAAAQLVKEILPNYITTCDSTVSIVSRIHSPEEECCLGPACWMWDYLRRSNAIGFLLPLSGGADSASVAAIVRVMCVLVAEAVLAGNKQVIADVTRIFKDVYATSSSNIISQRSVEMLTSDNNGRQQDTNSSNSTTAASHEDKVMKLANELTYKLLHTIFLGTVNSSTNTLDRSKRLAASIRSYHSNLVIDNIVTAVLNVFTAFSGKTPQFVCNGGTMIEDLALQNIQARLRMVMSYLCAQLFPWLRNSKGFLLVLSAGNVDEALRGYMTKYDCSSGDLNPIGGICKGDLKQMLLWISKKYNIPVLEEIADATPTAELRPIDESTDKSESTQSDEDEMGMTYKELGIFGYLRKVSKCGPVKMFLKLIEMWKNINPNEIAVKVKRFFYFYSINRHKLTTLTPSYHAECYAPDDNRYDLRPFLYNVKWTRQFNTIDSIVTSSSTPSNATIVSSNEKQ